MEQSPQSVAIEKVVTPTVPVFLSSKVSGLGKRVVVVEQESSEVHEFPTSSKGLASSSRTLHDSINYDQSPLHAPNSVDMQHVKTGQAVRQDEEHNNDHGQTVYRVVDSQKDMGQAEARQTWHRPV
ncbi:hypothetical protein ACOSQ3_025616 [Xanthoceras sorbifolium]